MDRREQDLADREVGGAALTGATGKDAPPRVKSASALRAPFMLQVEWADGTKSKVDMTGLVHSSRHFGIFADKPEEFRSVRPDEFGTGIEWENGLDYSARTLKTLADEQTSLPGRYLHRFERKFRLNTRETAQLLKVTPRTIENWRAAKKLPVAVCIAVRLFEHDPTAFAAHFRPVPVRPRGRPKIS